MTLVGNIGWHQVDSIGTPDEVKAAAAAALLRIDVGHDG